MKPFQGLSCVISREVNFLSVVKEGEVMQNKFPDGMTVDMVFDKYCDTVYRLAYARVGNKFDAEDILQTVFLKLCKENRAFDDCEHLKAWLLRVTINSSKNLLKSGWMRLTDSLNDSITAPKHEVSEVYIEVSKLPIKYRTVIHLHYFEGYSCAEIAEITSTTEATVKTRLKRARERLGKTLKGEI